MITFNQISKFQSKRYLFKDATFQINPGDRIGLVGPNGAGKTTLFRLIVGQESPDQGSVTVPDKFKIGYFSQDPAGTVDDTVLQAAMSGCGDVSKLEAQIELWTEQLSDPELDPDLMERILEQLGEAQTVFEAMGGYDLAQRAEEILGGLGFSREDMHKSVRQVSGGWRMRIELAKVLLLKPHALLLDEPTNHLDVESIIWLEEFLMGYDGAIFMTSHDRDFMNRIVRKIASIEMGTIQLYSGNYDFYEREYRIRIANLEAQADRQEAMLRKEEEFIARFKARASHAAQVQSRVKMIEKLERIEVPKEARAADFRWGPCPRSGDTVVSLHHIHKAFGPKLVLKDTSFQVQRQEKVALLGINGAGKSTLLKIMAGELEPDRGDCRLGANLSIGYFSQHHTEILRGEQTIFEAVQEVVPLMGRGPLQNVLGSLLFTGDDVEKKIGMLSGGERSRVVLARIIARQVNFLILDEPTNHLDMKTREILLEALRRFEGTVVFVSHDRHFLRDLASRVILIDHGVTTDFPGGLGYFLDKMGGHFPGSEYTIRVG
ncbi:MAG: ribosomal protection-like ABC-F family protein [Myxococcota bacterium]